MWAAATCRQREERAQIRGIGSIVVVVVACCCTRGAAGRVGWPAAARSSSAMPGSCCCWRFIVFQARTQMAECECVLRSAFCEPHSAPASDSMLMRAPPPSAPLQRASHCCRLTGWLAGVHDSRFTSPSSDSLADLRARSPTVWAKTVALSRCVSGKNLSRPATRESRRQRRARDRDLASEHSAPPGRAL